MVSSVELLNSVRIALCIASSVAKSTDAVASSIIYRCSSAFPKCLTENVRTMRFDRLNSALAIATNCLWPCEKLLPPAETSLVSVMVNLVPPVDPAGDAGRPLVTSAAIAANR